MSDAASASQIPAEQPFQLCGAGGAPVEQSERPGDILGHLFALGAGRARYVVEIASAAPLL
jgi:hypothetical protein